MELPLLERAQAGDDAFLLTTAANPAEEVLASLCGIGSNIALPPPPGPGEQYRFHFDMTKCIGCKCCVVACNEQNGNPADILWRRVGEIEGGTYPDTLRHYLSMGCNHCLEPTCMTGCPVDAYSKDGPTGIVRHSADICIGCQYCTWNCSYGVPQYNPERGVVGKCDMCYGRLTQGQQPACVSACPEDAIRIETVHIAEWREEYRRDANSPGMPSADDSLSTTRITLPVRIPRDLRKVDLNRLRPEHPHWPLVVMTVLTQLSVGAFTSIWLLRGFQRSCASRGGAWLLCWWRLLALACLHAASWPAHSRRARAEDVASLVAQPRSAAVHAICQRGSRLLRGALDALAWNRLPWRLDRRVWNWRCGRKRAPVSGARAPGMEFALHHPGVLFDRHSARLREREHLDRRISTDASRYDDCRSRHAAGRWTQDRMAGPI